MTSKNEEPIDMEKFDWVQLHKDMDTLLPTETSKQKFIRKVGENPFVPLGALLTTAALSYGLWSFKNGRHKMSQYMMRSRILAQGFTVVALIAGIAMGAHKL